MENILAGEKEIAAYLAQCTSTLLEDSRDTAALVFVGIQRRGVELAARLVQLCADQGVSVPLGILDITFYRDDLSLVSPQPVVHSTTIPFNLDERDVVLVDDVLYTGRTIRAALDALMDFGRPKRVRLAVLVDRGGRELPIQADYAGWQEDVPEDKVISVHVKERDGRDCITIVPRTTHTEAAN